MNNRICCTAGTIASLSISSAPLTGGVAVIINGTALGNGSDIVQVTLAGVPAAIVEQNTTYVIVTASPSTATASQTGDVQVHSASRGIAVLPQAWTYNARMFERMQFYTFRFSLTDCERSWCGSGCGSAERHRGRRRPDCDLGRQPRQRH